MHRLLILLLLPAGAACSSVPSGGDPDEISRLIESLDHPEAASRLVGIGDPAVPALRDAILDRALPADRRGKLAWVLGRIWTGTGNGEALDAYIRAVQAAKDSDSQERALLAQAHHFRDPEGRVLALMDKSLLEMRVVSAEMITAAAAMTDVEAVETMMKVIGRGIDHPTAPEREVAMRYLGRAARRGRREAIPFLTMCTQAPNADIMAKASEELVLLAGRVPPKGWRDWWFDNVSTDRREWLATSFDPVGGRPFDPADRDHLGDLIARIPSGADSEPVMWFLEQVLGRSFGYVSPRDVFDPDVDLGMLSEANRRAVETARDWWRETSPYLFFNSATRRFDISEEGRRIGVPVDPRTGKPKR